MTFLASESFIVRTVSRVKMPSGSIVTCDEYGIDGLSWVLKVLSVPVCEDTGSVSVNGT